MHNKSKEQDLEAWLRPRGRFKTEETLKCAERLEADNEQSEEQFNRLAKVIGANEDSYCKRKESEVFKHFQDGAKKKKTMSKDQRRQDIKYTDTSLGQIAFSSLRTDHF